MSEALYVPQGVAYKRVAGSESELFVRVRVSKQRLSAVYVGYMVKEDLDNSEKWPEVEIDSIFVICADFIGLWTTLNTKR